MDHQCTVLGVAYSGEILYELSEEMLLETAEYILDSLKRDKAVWSVALYAAATILNNNGRKEESAFLLRGAGFAAFKERPYHDDYFE